MEYIILWKISIILLFSWILYLPEQLSRYFVALCSSSRSFMSAYFMYAWVFGFIFPFVHHTSCQHVVCVNFFVSLMAELFHLPEPHFLSGGLEPELCRRLLWLRYKRARSCLDRSEDQNSIFLDFYFWSKLLSLVKPAVCPPCSKTSSHKTLSRRSPKYSK